MAKVMVYFNATKQIETITMHYNDKLDGAFVEDVAKYVKEVAKKMSRVDLKNPNEFDTIQVFVYPSRDLFYKVFAGEIEKRFYSRKRSLEDLYVVRDSEGNIHIVSPRGMDQEKREALKKILAMKVLGEYMDDKQKESAKRILKEVMKPKEEIDEETVEDEEIDLEEEEQEVDDEELDEIEEAEEELDNEELDELVEEEITDEEIEEIIQAEEDIGKIDTKEELEEAKETISASKEQSRNWLNVGWVMFVNGNLKKQKDVNRFAEYVSQNRVKKLSKLKESGFFEDYDFSPEFACALVEFIVKTYGMKKYVEYYNEPKDIKRIFGVSSFVFDAQFKSYVKEKYKSDKKMDNIMEDMKLEEIVPVVANEDVKREEKTIEELTVVRFSKAGGAKIDELLPVEKEINL